MKIAFLTSYNSDFLKKEFEKQLKRKNYQVELWWNSYGTHEQSVYDKSSSLHQFNPDLVIIHLEVESLLGNSVFDLLSLSKEDRKNLTDGAKAKIESLITTLANSFSKAKLVFENFIPRTDSHLGMLDVNLEFGLYEITAELNKHLLLLQRSYQEKLTINNYQELISEYGKANCFDQRLYRLGKFPFVNTFVPHLLNHYERFVNVFSFPRKKCIVLDLDNTLWGGIVGQDGFDNIELGGSGIGEAYVEFQRALLNYYRTGIFLAICSKNNYDDALEVLDKHPDMILRKNYFSSMKINWLDKAGNLRAVADELNIGIDSLVFLDDNPAECELVRQQLPEVEVVHLTGDPDNYIKQLMAISSLQFISLTEEDLSRNQMKYSDEKRKELESTFSNLVDFYRSLQMEAHIHVNDESHYARIAQLTQKTNQFNLTTRRYSLEQIKDFANSGSFKIYSLRLTDKFGDNGIVIVAIVKLEKDEWFIDTFLMSCRVIGRQAESALLNSIIEDAEKDNVKIIRGEYLATKKNEPASSFFKNHNFAPEDEATWKLNLPANLIVHQIKIIRN